MRYAVYFAPPPESQLHQLGSAWLGRDAYTGEVLEQPAVEGLAELTAEPRRYGFHATLKAPFNLQEKDSETELYAAIAQLAARQMPFELLLTLEIIEGFLAFVLARPSQRLDALAASCVSEIDSFRRPPDSQELARRRAVRLSERQESFLERWGYPYVFEDFRFHMTLTRRLSEHEAGRILPAAATYFAAVIKQPIIIDSVTAFNEPSSGAAFTAGPSFAFPRL